MKIFVLMYALTLNNGDSIKQWQEGPIAWSDFAISNDSPEIQVSAISSVGLTFSITEYGNDSILIETFSCFYRYESWTLDTNSLDLLEHEQLHFDIVELTRRQFIEKCIKYPNVSEEQIINYFKEAQNSYRRLNQSYDIETNHGLEKNVQRIWEDNIKSQLTVLNAFSDNKIILHL